MIRVKFRDRVLNFDGGDTRLEKLLVKLCVNPEDVLVLKDGRLIAEDEWIKDGEEIEIYEVVSRG